MTLIQKLEIQQNSWGSSDLLQIVDWISDVKRLITWV